MAVDPYAQCPCGSGKKLKFCCSDLVGDIEKIHHMVEGDQPRAALQHCEQTLKKRPGRPSLLDLKAMLEVTLHKLQDAEKTVAELLEKDPENPAAHAQQAILLCAQGDGASAVEPLQRALTLIEENMPRRVLEAIGAVGHTLLMEGNVVAARAHLWLYQGIAGREDTRALELLTRMNQVAGLPLLLRDHLYMHEAPAGHPAEEQHNYAQALAARGQWGPASAVFDQLCAAHPDVATFHYNRALVYGWLGEQQEFADGLREYADRTDDAEQAVEAEAIAQLIDPRLEEAAIDVLRCIYPILDEQEVLARLNRDAHAIGMPVDPAEEEQQDGPPPRHVWALLDRPQPATGVGLTLDQTPQLVGVVSHYGRQTSRAERLELVTASTPPAQEARAAFAERLSGVVGMAEEELVEKTDVVSEALRSHLHFPPDTPPDVRREITQQETANALAERWTATPLAALQGKSPEEAAQADGTQRSLHAAVLIIEQGSNNHRNTAAVAALREKLNLPAPGPVDPAEVDFDRVPLGRVPRIDLSGVSDDDVTQLYRRATLAGASGALRHAAQEVVRRPTLQGRLNLDDAYRRLVGLASSPDEAYQTLNDARRHAETHQQSCAPWDLLEFEWRLVEGDSERANGLLTHITTEHRDEPGVSEHLYSLLSELGLLPDDPAAPLPQTAAPPTQTVGAESQAGRIWTPDAGQPEGGKQKLWTPG